MFCRGKHTYMRCVYTLCGNIISQKRDLKVLWTLMFFLCLLPHIFFCCHHENEKILQTVFVKFQRRQSIFFFSFRLLVKLNEFSHQFANKCKNNINNNMKWEGVKEFHFPAIDISGKWTINLKIIFLIVLQFFLPLLLLHWNWNKNHTECVSKVEWTQKEWGWKKKEYVPMNWMVVWSENRESTDGTNMSWRS